jgi:hypothetical protein
MIRISTATAVLAASVALSVLAGTDANAGQGSVTPGSTAAPRYVFDALAGSGHYFVYGKFAAKPNGNPAQTGTLYYRTRHGKPLTSR